MPNTIILNSNNIVKDQYQNRLIYRFPQSMNLDHHEIAVASIQMYYSWFNISSQYGNNSFSYKWFDNITYSVLISDGFYTVKNLNGYLQSVMIANKHYLFDNNLRVNVYFLELVENSVSYSIQINAYPLSSTYATTKSWVLPSGASWTIPSSNSITQINILSNNFTNVIGISAGSYPVLPGTVDTSIIYSSKSSFCPQFSPVNSIVMTCSLVNSSYGNPTNIICSFSQNVSFGSMIDYKSSEFAYNDIYKSNYSDFTIVFLDQNLNPIRIIDPSMVITLLIKEK